MTVSLNSCTIFLFNLFPAKVYIAHSWILRGGSSTSWTEYPVSTYGPTQQKGYRVDSTSSPIVCEPMISTLVISKAWPLYFLLTYSTAESVWSWCHALSGQVQYSELFYLLVYVTGFIEDEILFIGEIMRKSYGNGAALYPPEVNTGEHFFQFSLTYLLIEICQSNSSLRIGFA